MANYARKAVARNSGGFTVSGNDVTLTAAITFAKMEGGAGGTVTHFGLGTAASGSGELLFFGTVSPNITVANGTKPELETGTTISQSSGDGMANTAATNLLKLLFQNTTWAGFGDSTGIVGSGAAGSLYFSLHTASPGESGNQSTNEISYT